MFAKTAHLYDLVYDSLVDYDARAAEIDETIRTRNPDARTLLDVGCGTGRYMERLQAGYEVAGIDIEPGMVTIAASRLPGVAVVQADMVSFDLGRRFDAVISPFSSIGYVRTLPRMRAAVAAMARHLAPGGVLVFDGWIERGRWLVGHIGANRGADDTTTVLRMVRSDLVAGDPDVSVMEVQYLVGTPEGISHLVEKHEMGLFSRADYVDACSEAGLREVRAYDSPMGSARPRIVASAPRV